MSKYKKGHGFGKFITLAAIVGAVAAGISYFTQYKSFHKELEEDFHDFEDDGDGSEVDSTMSRSYVALHADKDELKIAASDIADAAKDAAVAAKRVVKDAASIVADTAKEAASAASDTAQSVVDTAREKLSNTMEAKKEHAGNSYNTAEKAFSDSENSLNHESTTITEEDIEI